MAWDMTPIETGASERLPLESVDEDAKVAVEEAYAYFLATPTGERLIIPFSDPGDREDAARHIRSYCEARPSGRLTASIWIGWTGQNDKGVTVWSSAAEGSKYAKTPALSVKITTYLKRERDASEAPAETADPSPVG